MDVIMEKETICMGTRIER